MASETNPYTHKSNETVFAVYKPRLIRLVRHKPHHLSLGDEAVMEFDFGLLKLLLMRDCKDQRLGEYLSSTWVYPVAAGGSACYAAFEPLEGPSPNFFTGIRNVFSWNRECSPTETLLATAQIEAFGRTSISLNYSVASRERGDRILNGKLKFVSVGSHGPVPFTRDFQTSIDAHNKANDLLSHSRFRRTIQTVLPPRTTELLRRFRWAYLNWRGASQTQTASAVKKTESSATGIAKTADATITLKWSKIPVLLAPGEEASVELYTKNESVDVVGNLKIEIHLPNIDGLEFYWNDSATIMLQAGEEHRICGTLRHLKTSEAIPGQSYRLSCTLTREGNRLAKVETHVVAAEPFISEERTIFQLRHPRCLERPNGNIDGFKAGDHWVWSFPSDLLRLFLNPIAGGIHPLGRGFHPLGRVPEGAAIWFWKKTLGPDWEPDRLDIQYVAPIKVKHDFRISGMLEQLSDDRAVTDNKVYQTEGLVNRIELTFIRKN